MYKEDGKGKKRLKTTKETGERSLSRAPDKVFHCICSYTRYIKNLYVNVGKLPNHLKYVCCICLC